ncbi:MAG: ECF transporter S component [Actinomycetes bacterium]|jgi:uncharacterized membrane protein|nr:ECF transporter S component [Actinomycetes bacterium]
METRTRIVKLVHTALFAALIFALTFLVRVPIPLTSGGYVNLGDTAVFLAAALIGGPAAAVAAGVGSALADVAAGYALYAPATLVIKALMGLVCGALVARRPGVRAFVVAALVAGAVMVVGYALYESALYGVRYALLAAGFNCIQWGASVLCAGLLYPVARRVGALST